MQQHSWSETGMCTQGIYIILVATHCILIEPDKSRNDTITLQCCRRHVEPYNLLLKVSEIT